MNRLLALLGVAMLAPWAVQAEEEVKKVEKKVFVFHAGGEGIRLEFDDLADGETRTVTEGGKTIAVTRAGDELSVTVDGESVEGGGKKVVTRKIVVPQGEGGNVQSRVLVFGHDCEGKSAEDCEAQFRELHAKFDTEGVPHPGAEMLALHRGMKVYRCPEDGTEIHVKKENAAQAPFLCPLDNRAMNEVQAHRVAVHGYSFTTSDEKPGSQEDANR